MSASAEVVPAADVVELEVPADPAYVAVVRTATAGLAARLDLTLDRIEDLRIAIDEACTLLIHHHEGRNAGQIRCVYSLDASALTCDVTGPDVELPESTAYGWAVLSALVDSLESGHEDGPDGTRRTWIRLVVRAGAGSWS